MPETLTQPEATEVAEAQSQTRVYLKSRKTPIVVEGALDEVRTIVENAPDGTFVTFTSAGRRFQGSAVAFRASEVDGLREQEPPLLPYTIESAGYDGSTERMPFVGTLEDAIAIGNRANPGLHFQVQDADGNVVYEPEAPAEA